MPVSRKEMQEVVSKYNPRALSAYFFCSHSALPNAKAAKRAGFKVVGITTKGRDLTYATYLPCLFDEFVYINQFKNGVTKVDEELEKRIVKNNGFIFINRSTTAYCGYDDFENIHAPMIGGRLVQRAEDRNAKNNQYDILKRAGIPIPIRFDKPEDIDRLAVVKIQQKGNPLERAFFYPSNATEYSQMAKERIDKGIIDAKELEKARIEEVLVGPKFNANGYSFGLYESKPVVDERFVLEGRSVCFPTKVDLIGFGARYQANSSGLLQMPAEEQEKIRGKLKIVSEEVGHQASITARESLLEEFYKMFENLVVATNELYPGQMIGMFGLQGAIVTDQATLKPTFKAFDLSLRIPGDPGIHKYPYLDYLNFKYGDPLFEVRKEKDPSEYRKGLIGELNATSFYNSTSIEDGMDLYMIELAKAAKEGLLPQMVT